MVEAAAKAVDCRLEQVDGNGLLPLREGGKAWSRAHHFRRHLQRTLPPWLDAFPMDDPLASARLPAEPPRFDPAIESRWPAADLADLDLLVANTAIPEAPGVVPLRGGPEEALRTLDRFVGEHLPRYADERNQPIPERASGLSPYLHFGHVGAHEVARRILSREDWDPSRLSDDKRGSRGWWGLSEEGEAFMDELVTWRELGFGSAFYDLEAFTHYEGLPAWARETLEDHAEDEREHLYTLEELAEARTHDEVWNAAQTQLLREGRIHNYLRMVWGKKVLEWTEHPKQGFDWLVELNNRYALDGRDPNSWSGIGWVFGRFDRAWGPERPIFGKIRYMSSANTKRKLRLGPYLERYGPTPPT